MSLFEPSTSESAAGLATAFDAPPVVSVPIVNVPAATPPAKPAPAARQTRRIEVLGLPIDDVTKDEAVRLIREHLEGDLPCQMCFVNADCVNVAARDDRYRFALQAVDFTFADGVGMSIAARALGRPLRDNVNGTDLFPLLCEELEETGVRVFLLGGYPGVSAAAAAWMQTHFPGVFLCGWHDGYFDASEEATIVRKIANAKTDLLLVGFGEPRQTLWIQQHLRAINVKVAIGVGGLFDFYSGRVPRAPVWVRRLRAEWVYRLSQEPQRLWRRYLIGNFAFLWRLRKAMRGTKQQPQVDAGTLWEANPFADRD
ncbi:MAG TPA: WecB/TagA/CpsF family glycosyltransferase [Pirellulales bacterium]|nr:WecB/TagA/CpsF family glycosyltransferase [Pirellulales bacterium]